MKVVNGKLLCIFLLFTLSAVKMVKKTGEVFVQKPGEDVPKIFTFDSVYDWK
jgi:hypothetical protein